MAVAIPRAAHPVELVPLLSAPEREELPAHAPFLKALEIDAIAASLCPLLMPRKIAALSRLSIPFNQAVHKFREKTSLPYKIYGSYLKSDSPASRYQELRTLIETDWVIARNIFLNERHLHWCTDVDILHFDRAGACLKGKCTRTLQKIVDLVKREGFLDGASGLKRELLLEWDEERVYERVRLRDIGMRCVVESLAGGAVGSFYGGCFSALLTQSYCTLITAAGTLLGGCWPLCSHSCKVAKAIWDRHHREIEYAESIERLERIRDRPDLKARPIRLYLHNQPVDSS